MRIAVASGKGGVGKTTVASSLAWLAGQMGLETLYLDCDVEEPNGWLFLRPEAREDRPIATLVPQVDSQRCNGCGRCGQVCRFSAIVSMNRTVLTFPELCHSCGGCSLLCPAGAISERARTIGQLRIGQAGRIPVVEGRMNVGEAMAPPVIRAVKSAVPDREVTLLDCPPGTACPMIEAVRGCDHVLLVGDATPFGLHDMKLAVDTVRQLSIPLGVIINRCDGGDGRTVRYCREESIPILAELPDRRAVAELGSRGQLAAEQLDEYRAALEPVLTDLLGVRS